MKNQVNFFDVPNFIGQSNPDIEELVLGCFINYADTYTDHSSSVSIKDFSTPENRIIFYCIMELADNDKKIDIGMICNAIIKGKWEEKLQEKKERFNLIGYVEDICDRVSTDENLEDHINELNEFAKRRQLSELSEKIANKCNDFSDPDNIIETASQELYKIQEMGDVTDETPMELLASYIESKNKKHDLFIYTGIKPIDNFTNGFKSPDQVIIAAKASMGKTSLVLQIFDHNIKKGVPCGFFSLEMDKDQLMDRIFSLNCGIEAKKFRGNQLNAIDWANIQKYISVLENKNFHIDDKSSNLSTIINKIRKWVIRHKIKFVVIDYLQLVMCDTKSNNREQEIATISRRFKALARELNIVVFALSQLNRNNAQRSDKRPILSDLRESGSIEQDADVVMFIHREEYYQYGTNSRVEQAEIIFAKGRSIGVGTVNCLFQSSTTKFYSDEDELPEYERQALHKAVSQHLKAEAEENPNKDKDLPFT